MNLLLLFVPLFLFLSIGKKPSLKEELFQPDSIEKYCLVNHSSLKNFKGNLNSFKSFEQKLDTDLLSIPTALDYIKTCIRANDSLADDSVFYYFRKKFYSIMVRLSDSVISLHLAGIKPNSKDCELCNDSNIYYNLNYCGINLYINEADGDYLDELPDYLYANFKDRVSQSVREFLSLRQSELNQGFTGDGGLIISFEELWQRIKNWERYNTLYPASVCKNEAHYYYDIYLRILLTGLDNSPIFDDKTNALDPDTKLLYEKIIKTEASTNTSKIISSYYQLLSKNNFIKNDTLINSFLKEHNLASMIEIEPQFR